MMAEKLVVTSFVAGFTGEQLHRKTKFRVLDCRIDLMAFRKTSALRSIRNLFDSQRTTGG